MSKEDDLMIRRTVSTPDSGTESSGSLTSSMTSLTSDRLSPFQCSATSGESSSSGQTVMVRCYDIAPIFDKENYSSSCYEDNPICEKHGLNKDYFCYTCVWEVCMECVKSDHNEHYLYPGLSCKELYKESERVRKSIKDNMVTIEHRINDLQYRKMATIGVVQQFFSKLHKLINRREEQLLATVNYVSDCRSKILDQKLKEHQSAVSSSLTTTNALIKSLTNGSSDNILQASRCAKHNLEVLRRTQRNFQCSDEDIVFVPPDKTIVNAIRDIGSISSHLSYAAGVPVVNDCVKVTTDGYNNVLSSFQSFSPFAAPGASPQQRFFPISSTEQRHHQLQNQRQVVINEFDGAGAVDGINGIAVTEAAGLLLTGNHRSCFPTLEFPVSFHINRNYSKIKRPVTVFGVEGNGDGELCRPWGVCCDAYDQVIVADRSNNRIQIFRLDGTFVRKFGSAGCEEGQLNRPAAVAVDYCGRIVVTDKDNHRVQIFTMDGNFLLSFGERGQANGQFHYPWDLAINSHGVIVVSDTRNHRVQMFTDNGVFLKKFGFESMSNMWKYFDSPRGVCFTSPNTVIVTDFNNHRLYEVDIEKSPKIINPNAYKKCVLFRPQGVAVDRDGNILVADCRHNRIQVFSKEGEDVGQFGIAGKEPGQFDRPSGIALTSDGKIIVVDFGNNRIQVF